jgi:S-formylglutathione hydrolase FrmB
VPLPGLSRSGVVADRLFYSAALDREMPYRVYLPPGYATTGPDGQPATKRYPVLYLLHGLDAGLTQWTNLGLLDELDRLAAAGEVIPFVVVMPSGRTGYWVNHAGGGPRWGDYVAKDLVAHVDATYRTIPQRQARAIGGISMGAHGALQLALNNPDVFGAAGAHSPSLRARTQAPPFLGGFFVNQSGGPGQAAYEARDPISLVRRAAPAPPAAVWIDVGDRDPWAPRARELHTALIERGWAHEWQPAAGSHEDAYWRGRMADYVRFYRQTLLPSFTA